MIGNVADERDLRAVPDLPFPASGGVLDAFLERMRFSPRAQVTIDWLINCLGISQRANAGQTYRWLQLTGILDRDGRLADRGQLLLFPTRPEYADAATGALESLVGTELLTKIRAGTLNRAALRSELRVKYGVGPSTANKVIVGMYAVAQLAGDLSVTRALGRTGYRRHEPKYPHVDVATSKRDLLQRFDLFTGRTGGIDGWLNQETPDVTFERLMKVSFEPLTASQLNQLLTLAHAPPLSTEFFAYYWLCAPPHPYDVTTIPCYHHAWQDSLAIFDLEQLYWGLYRFYTDALLYFGNVRLAYQVLRVMDSDALREFFAQHLSNTDALVGRGRGLPLAPIKRDDRYLIAEQACKSYAPADEDGISLETALREAYQEHSSGSGKAITAGQLLSKEPGGYIVKTYPDKQGMFEFAADEVLGELIASEKDLERILEPIKARFGPARDTALANTQLYLSSVGDLDVYVATSMRSRQDFHTMTDFCLKVFDDRRLRKYNLRYFDPTMSAAENHEDKGLIECLMVKCAKMLIYTAGDRDSYGKDAEAAMALSLGKPVIFFCSSIGRQQFYRDVHPLSRLVNFQSGVAVGVMVTDSEDEVVELIDRLLSNSMQYQLEQKRPGYLVLREKITKCVVRLQTSDGMLRETFWNHYRGVHGRPDGIAPV